MKLIAILILLIITGCSTLQTIKPDRVRITPMYISNTLVIYKYEDILDSIYANIAGGKIEFTWRFAGLERL